MLPLAGLIGRVLRRKQRPSKAEVATMEGVAPTNIKFQIRSVKEGKKRAARGRLFFVENLPSNIVIPHLLG